MIWVDKCIFCGEILSQGEVVCSRCQDAEKPLTENCCPRCGHEKCRCAFQQQRERELDGLCACYFYHGQAARTVSRFKFSGNRALGRGMGKLMAERVASAFPEVSFDGICYVPSSFRHLMKRGYNQAAVLARTICAFTSLPVYDKILHKRPGVKTQHMLGASERLQNVRDAYRITDPKRVYGKTLLLVDDVSTTGATLHECAGELKGAGAKAVYAVCFALTQNRMERKDTDKDV